MKVYSLGSLNIDYVYSVDHFVTPGETISSNGMNIFPGGKGLNQSIALARAGAKVIHGAVLGNDGSFLRETLSESGVDVSRIKMVDSSSGHAIIQVDKSGQNCILLFAGTNHFITDEYVEEFLADAEENDIILLQNEVNNLNGIFEAAKAKGLQIAFNPSPFNDAVTNLPLKYVKWWFCNEVEGAELFGSDSPEMIAKNFKERYPLSNLILTLGKDGCRFINEDCDLYQPIFETKVVDTTAAGDTFTGYFLASVIDGKPIPKALENASKASSITVSRAGASVSIPYNNEI